MFVKNILRYNKICGDNIIFESKVGLSIKKKNLKMLKNCLE